MFSAFCLLLRISISQGLVAYLVDPCRDAPCLNNATCVSDPVNDQENFTCICPEGFQGPRCGGLHLALFPAQFFAFVLLSFNFLCVLVANLRF